MDNQILIENEIKYDSTKTYTVYVNPHNRHIIGFVGFVVPVEELNDGNNFLFFQISDLTEKEYAQISRSINSTESMAFLGDDNRKIIFRKIYIDLLEETTFDAKKNMLCSPNNIVTLKVNCVDENLNIVEEIKEIEVKNIKKGGNPISFNDGDPDKHKIFVPNGSEVKCELLGEVVHTIKVKVKIPGIDYAWLTAYPQIIKLSKEEREHLKTWLKENAGQPV
jgi:hypothetical protein